MRRRARRRNAKSRRSTNVWCKNSLSLSYGNFFPAKTTAPTPFSPFTPAPAAQNLAIGPICFCECTNVGSSVTVTNPKRSEEHTSELQSQSNLVCRLLLEKKKHYNMRTSLL